jgi:hypothetical protein
VDEEVTKIRTTFGGLLVAQDDGLRLLLTYHPPMKTPDGDYQPSPEGHTVATIPAPTVRP